MKQFLLLIALALILSACDTTGETTYYTPDTYNGYFWFDYNMGYGWSPYIHYSYAPRWYPYGYNHVPHVYHNPGHRPIYVRPLPPPRQTPPPQRDSSPKQGGERPRGSQRSGNR